MGGTTCQCQLKKGRSHQQRAVVSCWLYAWRPLILSLDGPLRPQQSLTTVHHRLVVNVIKEAPIPKLARCSATHGLVREVLPALQNKVVQGYMLVVVLPAGVAVERGAVLKHAGEAFLQVDRAGMAVGCER